MSTAAGAIVAAVKFDTATPAIVAAAGALARRSAKPLVLVHVYSSELPVYSSSYAERTTGRAGVPAAARQLGDRAWRDLTDDAALWTAPIEVARERLTQLAAELGDNVAAAVLVGDFPETLLEHAAGAGAALVVTGASTRAPGFLRARLRHTYRLMAKTALPVLVLPDKASPFELARRPLRILVADDLTEASRPTLAATAALIRLLELPVAVLHLHVETLSGLTQSDRHVTQRHGSLLARLKTRAEPLAAEVVAAGGTYRTELWHGRVGDELTRAAQVTGADVAVFGQHRFLHPDRLTFGHMPFGAMLGVGSAVLVAPPSPA